MFIAAIVGQDHFPMLGKVLAADTLEEVIDKAVALLENALPDYALMDKEAIDQSYTEEGVTVAVGEVESA